MKQGLLYQSYGASLRMVNTGKQDQLRELHKAWVKGLQVTMRAWVTMLFRDGRLTKWLPTGGFDDSLSQRQWASVANQSGGMVRAWLASLENGFRHIVRGSGLGDDEKHALYSLNKRHAWYEQAGKNDEAHRLARAIMRQVRKRVRVPSLKHCPTMDMDGKVARIEHSGRTRKVSYWARVSTLTRGKPVLVPLVTSERYRDALANGEDMVQHLQVRVGTDGSLTAHLMTTRPFSEPREEGESLGLDWGLRSMFALSDGRLEGLRVYTWLKKRDEELVSLTKSLQRDGVKPSRSKRYRCLNKRIRDYVTNEVNRVLNHVATESIRELVVEDLDFRAPRLGKRVNRILNRAGRAAVRKKLEQLRDKQGILVTRVNPAYTSQQCSNCGHVSKDARKGTIYTCACCDKHMNADVNASRNILTRRSRENGLRRISIPVIHSMLTREHAAQCPRCTSGTGTPLLSTATSTDYVSAGLRKPSSTMKYY